MKYRSTDGEEEIIWNSRDGVTPYNITLRSGKQAMHVDWHLDRCIPDYVPPSGSRIFIDLTADKARQYAAASIQSWIDKGHKLNAVPSVEELVSEYTQHPGAPDLVEVP